MYEEFQVVFTVASFVINPELRFSFSSLFKAMIFFIYFFRVTVLFRPFRFLKF